MIPNAGGNVERLDDSYIAGGDIKDNHSGKQLGSFFEKLNMQLPYNPATALLGI